MLLSLSSSSLCSSPSSSSWPAVCTDPLLLHVPLSIIFTLHSWIYNLSLSLNDSHHASNSMKPPPSANLPARPHFVRALAWPPLTPTQTAPHPPRSPAGGPLTALSVKTGAPLSQKRKRKRQPEPLPLAARLGPPAPPADSPPPPPPPASPPPPPPPQGPHAPVRVPPRAIHPLNAHVTRLSSVQETVHFLALPAFRELLVPGAKPWLRSNWPVPDHPDEPARDKPRLLSFAIVYSAPEAGGDEGGAPDPSAPAVHVAAGAVVTKTLTDADFDFLDSLFLPPSAGISGEIPASPAPAVPVFTIHTGGGAQAIAYTDKRWRALKLVYDAIDTARALGIGVWLSNGRRSVRCAADGASASFGTRSDGTPVEDKREEEAGREVGEIVEVHRPGSGGIRPRSSAVWTDSVFGLMVGDAFWAMRR